MKWPPRVQVIVNDLAAKHPDLVTGNDDARRKLTGFFAEQCRFELGPTWGRKRYDDGPISTDVICYKDNSIYLGWDTQLAGGVIAQMPDSKDFSQDPHQIFVAVEPVDHLGSSDHPPGPAPNLVALLQAVEELTLLVKDNLNATLFIKNKLVNGLSVTMDFPSYEGAFKLNYFGSTRFSLTPKE